MNRQITVLAIVMLAFFLSSCGDECSQDYPPPTETTNSSNPYSISYLSSDLGIGSTRWENITTGGSGTGSVTQVYECLLPIGCGNWSRVSNEVQLTSGENAVYTYQKSDGCEWRDDYIITLK